MNGKLETLKFVDDEFEMDINISPSEETIWLSMDEIALLFNRDRSVIGKHIRKIYLDKELDENRTWAKNARHLKDGRIYWINYNRILL